MYKSMINKAIEAIIFLFILVHTAYHVHAQPPLDVSYAKKEHKILTQFAGHWKQLYEHNPIGSSKPGYGKGESVNRILYKGVYIEFNGRLFYTGGAIISKTIIGYDEILERYFLLSYDSVGHMPLLCHGEYDPESNKFTFIGEIYYTTSVASKVRVEIYFERDDKYIFDFYRIDNNQEQKILTVANIRKAE